MNIRYWAVVPAAGKGTRMGAPLPKQYLSLEGRTVLEHTLGRLLGYARFSGVVVAIAADDDYFARLPLAGDRRLRAVTGGAERCHSVLAALDDLLAQAGRDDWVLVHDAARPCVRLSDIETLVAAVGADAVGGILALRATDTIKQSSPAAGDAQRIVATFDRTTVWQAQTPQMFRLGALRDALAAALSAGIVVTDEAQAMERTGRQPLLVEGARDNIKITRPDDLALAAFWLGRQQDEAHREDAP